MGFEVGCKYYEKLVLSIKFRLRINPKLKNNAKKQFAC